VCLTHSLCMSITWFLFVTSRRVLELRIASRVCVFCLEYTHVHVLDDVILGCNLMHFILPVDVLGQIVGVSKLGHVHMSTNTTATPKRVITLRDDR
jgi:hypothetical protein